MITRRSFLAAGATAAGLATLRASAQPDPPASSAICVFSKHLQFLNYEDLARTCKDLGLDGVDLTVRPKGHVEPQNLDRDLPMAVEAIRAHGLDVPMISTNLTGESHPDAPAIFAAAAKADIPYVRVDGGRYPKDSDPSAELPRLSQGLRTLATLAHDHGITLGLHIHSGEDRIGSVVWDLHQMLTDIALDNLGANFDVGHVTVTGGLMAWDLHTRLMAPHVKMVAVKDFVWEGDKVRWVPLGQGIVKTAEMLKTLRARNFTGPISIHLEYDTPSNDALLEDIRAATEYLRSASSPA